MTLLAIDFETYFDNECTLKRLNYIQYLNHPKFEVLGAAIIHEQRHEFLTHDVLVDFLPDLDPTDTEVVAHKTAFDGLILSWRYGFNPRRWLDTMSMAKGLLALDSYSLESVGQHFELPHKKSATFKSKTWSELTFEEQRDLVDYARHDVWLCHEIYQRLMPYPEPELAIIDHTIRLFTEPKFQLDTALATSLLAEQKQHKKELIKETGLTKTQLSSNKQFAEILKTQHGFNAPTKISLTTGKETHALAKNDVEFQDMALNAPPEVKKLIEARLTIKSTIEETRLETLIETQELVGAIPVPLNYYGGHTGRFSGAIFNLQNLPRNSKIRNTLCAPPGHTLVIADSASIEARVLAWFAEQKDLLEVYRAKRDPYKRMAAAIYNKPETEITKEERTIGKEATLGMGYSMGANKFHSALTKKNILLTEQEAQRITQIYRKTNDKVPQLWRFLDSKIPYMAQKKHNSMCQTNENPTYKCVTFEPFRIKLPNDLYLKYPNLHMTDDGWVYGNNKKLYGGALTENIIQALARIIVLEQAMRAHTEVAPVVLHVHDEIVCCVPSYISKNKTDQALKDLINIMRTPPAWAPDLPLDAEGEISPYYKKPA